MSGYTPFLDPGVVQYPSGPYQPELSQNQPQFAPQPPAPAQTAGFSPYQEPYQEQPLQGGARYRLYDRTFSRMEVAQWQNTPRDDSEGSLFWRTHECFQGATFLANSRSRKEKDLKFAPIPFYVLVLMSFCMFTAAVARLTKVTGADIVNFVSKAGWEVVAVGMCIAIVSLVIVLLVAFLAPTFFMKGGVLGSCVVVLLAWIVSTYYFGNAAPMAAVFLLGLVGFFCQLAVKESESLGAVMLGMVADCMRSSHFIVLFIAMIGIALLIGWLWALSIFIGIVVLWHQTYSAFVFFSFWYTVSVLGQMTYQMGAQLTAYKFFLEGCQDAKFSRGDILSRIWQNMGIACTNGFIIPILYPFMVLAKIDPEECQAIAAKYCDEGFAKFVGSLINFLHALGMTVATSANSSLGYPSEEGSVYSAMFGVTRREGCRRFAEICSKNYVDLMHCRCMIDYIFGFVMLVIEATGAILTWDSVKVIFAVRGTTGLRYRRLGGAIGFFSAYAVFYITKQLIKAITDTTIICYYEFPQRLRSVYGRLDEPLRDEYAKAQLGARRVVQSEQAVETADGSTLGQSLVSESGLLGDSTDLYVSVPSTSTDSPRPTYGPEGLVLVPPSNA